MGKNKRYSHEFKQEVLVMVAGRAERQSDRAGFRHHAGIDVKVAATLSRMENDLQPSAERAEQAEIRQLKRELEITAGT